jgi:hypothetical protein
MNNYRYLYEDARRIPFTLNYKPTPGGLKHSGTSRAGEPARLESGVVPTPLSVPRHSEAQPGGWAYNRVSTVPAPRMSVKWPSVVPVEVIQQLEAVFAEKEYWVSASITPLTVCQCDKQCPTVKVNITECRNFGIIPVALCRFNGKSYDDEEKVKLILEQVGEPLIKHHVGNYLANGSF